MDLTCKYDGRLEELGADEVADANDVANGRAARARRRPGPGVLVMAS